MVEKHEEESATETTEQAAESETGDSIQTGVDPKTMVAGVGMLLVVGILGWAFYSNQPGGSPAAGGAPASVGSSNAGGASGIPAEEPPSLAKVERLILAGKLPEARDGAMELDLALKENIDALESIKALFDAENHLQGGRANQASRALARVAEQYRNVPMALELQLKVENALGDTLKSKATEAESHFRAERYDSAKRAFMEVLALQPENKRAKMMAEAAGMAEPLRKSIEECDALLREVAYAKLEEASGAALATVKAAKNPGVAEQLATLVERLKDYNCHARMIRSYDVEGNAEEAARLRDSISEGYAIGLSLRPSDQIREVGKLAAKAEEENSFEVAQLVLAKEPNSQNAINRRMAALSRKIREESEATRQSRLDKARELNAAGDIEAALVACFSVVRDSPTDIDARNFHAELAGKIFTAAHQLVANPEDTVAERTRLLTLVKENSLVDTTVRAQAENALRRLEIEQTRAAEDAAAKAAP
jgi:hypothetical protein